MYFSLCLCILCDTAAHVVYIVKPIKAYLRSGSSGVGDVDRGELV
jgi:hypothetical protein